MYACMYVCGGIIAHLNISMAVVGVAHHLCEAPVRRAFNLSAAPQFNIQCVLKFQIYKFGLVWNDNPSYLKSVCMREIIPLL